MLLEYRHQSRHVNVLIRVVFTLAFNRGIVTAHHLKLYIFSDWNSFLAVSSWFGCEPNLKGLEKTLRLWFLNSVETDYAALI